MKVVTARGSAHEIGVVIGRECAGLLRGWSGSRPPVSEEDAAAFVRGAWGATVSGYPALAREVEGLAEGAGLPLWEVFLHLCEELWEGEEMGPSWGCTDVVVRGRAVVGGGVLVGHTNDSGPDNPGFAVVNIVPDDGRPASTGVSMDAYAPAVGRNGRGIVLTGNQLTSGDVRVGVPRLILARAVLDEETLEGAARVCLDPNRASSYNNILADGEGRVLDLEGSATRTAPIPFRGDVLVHTNHYLAPGMTDLERKWDQASTRNRLAVAEELVRQLAPCTPETLAAVLSSHEGKPDCICSHDDQGRTFFAVVYEPQTGRAWISDGPPCMGAWSTLPTAQK